MVKKPSELINGSVPPSQNVPQQTTSGASSNWLSTLIVLLLAGWLVYSIASRYDWGDRQQDHHEEKDDNKKQDDKKQDDKNAVVVKPGFLIIVRERISTVADDEAAQRIALFASKQTGLESRDVDKDDDSEAVRKMIKHAEAKGVSPPFVIYKSKANELGGVIKMPAADAPESALMEVFK